MNTLPITVIVPVKNEEQNLPDCLETLRQFEKVYVVDSFSTDSTEKIARDHGATVVQFKYNGGWPKKKNWSLTNLKILTPWTLILDADERISRDLLEEISTAINNTTYSGYYLKWKFIFLGKWMRFSWSHGWMLRLFRTGSSYYENLGMTSEGGWDNEVHENLICDGQCAKLNNHLLHESNQSISHWLSKQNQFSDWSAVRRLRTKQSLSHICLTSLFVSTDPLQRRKAMKAIYLKLPLKPLVMFVYLYIFKMGFLDGKIGLIFCTMRSIHEYNTSIKMFEQERFESESNY